MALWRGFDGCTHKAGDDAFRVRLGVEFVRLV
jgi:hypothetical protein